MAVSAKLISFYGLTASAGFMAYAFSFTITDITGEIYGKKAANLVVFGGFVAAIIGLIILQLAILIPEAHFTDYDEAFITVFGSTWRITLAGVVAYLTSQYLDVYLFHKIRARTGSKMLWLRNNLSTGISQLVDTCIFITIGFGFTYGMVAGQYLLKLGIAAVDTLIVYLVIYWIRNHKSKASPSLTDLREGQLSESEAKGL